MNNMVMAIIPREEAEIVMSALLEAGHTATFVETKGGVFRQSQFTMFIVVDDQNLDTICKLIESNCKVDMEIEAEGISQESNESFPSANKLGGAVVFVWKLNQIISF